LSMDLQQKSWFSEVRTTPLDGGSVVVGCDKESDSPEAKQGAPCLAAFARHGIRQCQLP
jgi:hypothetical protein